MKRTLEDHHSLILPVIIFPGIVLALIGLTHPMELNNNTALYWRNMHIVTLFLFPLLVIPPYLLLRGATPLLRKATAILLYGFAFMYTVLDALNGIGAGQIYIATHPATAIGHHAMHSGYVGFSPSINAIFDIGLRLGTIGAWLYLAACSVVAGWSVVRQPTKRERVFTSLGGTMVVGAAISFLSSHIYWPRGVFTMLLLSAGFGILWLVRTEYTAKAS